MKTKIFQIYSIIGSITLIFLCCSFSESKHHIAAGSPNTSYYKVAYDIATTFTRQNGVEMEIISQSVFHDPDAIPLGSFRNCNLLSERKVDFAISQNDVSLNTTINPENNIDFRNIRSVLPLYPEIFFLLYKPELNSESLYDLLKGKKVAMGPRDSGTTMLARTLFKELGIDSTIYQPVYLDLDNLMLSDSVDICCLVTGFDNYRIRHSLEYGGKIFNFGDYKNAGAGSVADGFCLKYPLAKPYILPNRIYNTYPEHPILTVAIDAVLLTHADVDNQIVYDVIRTILENKQTLVVDFSNKILSQMTEKFDPLRLRFPLHAGARQYLERNRPSFWERYAELMGFVFSLLVAIVGGATTFAKWNRQHKKNRIDKYYEKVIELQKQVGSFQTLEKCEQSINNLRNLRETAFKQLIDEKLNADDSFRIFITFVNDTQNEIWHRMEVLKSTN